MNSNVEKMLKEKTCFWVHMMLSLMWFQFCLKMLLRMENY